METTELKTYPYYVICDDRFMSFWGLSEGKINTIVLGCADYTTAQIVANNARGRSDQKNIKLLDHKPTLYPTAHYYSIHDESDYKGWYTPFRWYQSLLEFVVDKSK